MGQLNGHASTINRLAVVEPFPEHPSEQRPPNRGGGRGGRKSNPATGARFKTLNSFVDYTARTLDTTAQAAWLVLFREVRSTGVAKVSFSQVAERLGVSRRTAIRAVQQLEESKLIVVVERGKLNCGPSAYKVFGVPQGPAPGVTHVTSKEA